MNQKSPPPKNLKPRVFLGSASESRAIVDALEAELRKVARIDRWDMDVFRPGHFTLEELIRFTKEVDYAIFVLGQEDKTESRGSAIPSPRDNVIFEAGLFTAILGRERTFYVVDKAGTKIPSDWAGLGYTFFDSSEERPRDKVYDSATKIEQQIAKWQSQSKLGPLASIVGHWWQFVINSNDGAILSLLEFAASEPAGLRIEGTSWAGDGEEIARYHSRSADYDVGTHTVHYYWAGEHQRKTTIPRYFGVGEVTFRDDGDDAASRATGWFSSSSSDDVKDSLTKSTLYLRATPEEIKIIQGTDLDKRDKLIQSKLAERKRL